ncbi:MAG: AbrB/MazE/SpoVT family DNA-binding domain-containing protein [Clostridia bacterium]|nr:AbrB/MazE/SpoVT family DNA-binding domain-containing protein [Clostridia bacterium]
METARVFSNGRSQAVRIPKEYRFHTDEVFINKIGDALVLTPVHALAEAFDKGAAMLTDDFLAEGVPESIASEREKL